MAGGVRGARFWRVVVRSRAVLCSVGLFTLLVACGTAPPQAKPVSHPSSGVPAGYTEFRDSGRGYALALPSSWTQINVQSPQAAAAFAQLIKEKPQFTKVFGSNLSALAKQNMSLLAVGPSGVGLNMVVETGAGSQTAAQLGTLFTTVLQPAYAQRRLTLVSHQPATLDGPPALRIAVAIAVAGVTVAETQFVAGV